MVSEALRELHGTLLQLPRTRAVVDAGDGTGRKLLVFGEAITAVPDSLPAASRAFVSGLLNETPPRAEIVRHQITLDWTHMTTDAILRQLLPPALCTELPSAFETVGHIAHLNLRDELRPYARTIGDVLLAKNPHTLRTVVCKTASIETEFRTFPMRVVAGEDRLDAELHEGQCVFRFNFAEVYWNSRLQTEHARLVALFDPAHDVVCDVFAGVGPFALPAAKRGCVVYANDLNPRSYYYLVRNAEANGVADKVHASNLDGREFVRGLAMRDHVAFTRVIMNLPGESPEFLDVFGEIVRAGWTGRPIIHCYAFSRNASDPLGDILARVRSALGVGVDAVPQSIHDVRDVAPNKRMYCVNLVVVPSTIVAAAPTPSETPLTKKQKIGE